MIKYFQFEHLGKWYYCDLWDDDNLEQHFKTFRNVKHRRLMAVNKYAR